MKMKRWPKHAACLWLAISALCSTKAFAQNEAQTFAFANDMMAHGNFDGAILNYQRVIFFSENDSLLLPAYVHLADYWQDRDSFARSNEYLQLAYFSVQSAALKNEFALRRAENFILQKLYLEATEELLSVNPTNESTEKELQFYDAVVQFGLGNFDKSEALFLTYVDSTRHPEEARNVHKLFDRNERLNRVKPKTAMVLSMIVPGAGQMYSGDYRNGLNSLLLNSFFVWLFINTGVNNGWLDAFTSVFPWYFRYYTGGYKRSETIAFERIAMRRARIYHQIVESLPSY